MSNKITTKQVRLNVSDCASYTSNFVNITMPVPPWELSEAALPAHRKGETPADQRSLVVSQSETPADQRAPRGGALA